MTKQDIIRTINDLETKQGKWKYKALRNYRMYSCSSTISLNNIKDTEVPGYFSQGTFDIEDDTTSPVKENVIKSAIDTLCSMIASKKVRPFFNTVNGSFRDKKLCIQAQQFFDLMFDEWDIVRVITDVFRDACIFDVGYLFFDDTEIKRVLPWQVFVDEAEATYGKINQLVYKQTQWPYKSKSVTRYLYWNKDEGIKAEWIPETNGYSKTEWTKPLPWYILHYSNPIKGNHSLSVVDDLYGIQLEMDSLMTKIKDASQLSPAMTFFVPEDSSIDTTKLTNRVGQVIPYTVPVGVSANPITVATPAFIDSQYIQLLSQLKQDAYNIVGVSEASAESKKPTGLNSGIALGTMENIESQRFQVQMNKIIKAYVDIAKMIIELYNGNVLPVDKNRQSIKWTDIRKAKDKMVIQFSAAEFLSKDPSQKYNQLMAMAASGLIPKSSVTMFMQMPDMESGYNIVNNAFNAVMTVIERAIDKDDYDIPVFIPLDMLMEECLSCCLNLEAANAEENYDDIQKLLKLYDTAKSLSEQDNRKQDANNQIDTEANSVNQQADQYSNKSAQLDDIANQVQAGTLSPEEAQSLLQSIGV